jgi:hypothetical protein
MCQRITCKDCGKPSFAGCGRHVESVLGDVPPADRCQCGATTASAPARDIAGTGVLGWMADMLKPNKGGKNR